MKPSINDEDFKGRIEKVASELKRARREKSGFLHYASLIGMGGWLLALPIVAGAYLGHFLDEKTDMGVSWSLTFIILGIAAGIFNVWYFLFRE